MYRNCSDCGRLFHVIEDEYLCDDCQPVAPLIPMGMTEDDIIAESFSNSSILPSEMEETPLPDSGPEPFDSFDGPLDGFEGGESGGGGGGTDW